MHSSEKRLILLHSPQKKKKNSLSEKQKQLEVLFFRLKWLLFLWNLTDLFLISYGKSQKKQLKRKRVVSCEKALKSIFL